jgi:NAD(P)-dependent dehydrogenase (short-subunit alcohol dehydrogenase family)
VDRLKRKIALITGGNSGIGLASAKLFASEGAKVVIAGRDGTAIDRAAAEIGGNAIGIKCDVSGLGELDALFQQVRERVGSLDIVFANAGIMSVSPLQNSTEEHFDREFDVNVKGVFFTVQKSLSLLKDGGSIILTSSIANFRGTSGLNVYSATKAAVRSFARSWTSDLKDRRIRVNSISPGPTDTPMAGKLGLPEAASEAFQASLRATVPLGRFGTSEEIAQAALFLASDDSSFVTGIDLCVDGGMGQI